MTDPLPAVPTLTSGDTRTASAPTRGALALVWLFPRPTEPAVDLDLAPGEELVIGRDAGATVRIADQNVSRRHAALRHEENTVYLADLGSRNGTYVNGRPVKAAALERGDVVRVGDTVALVTDRPGSVREVAPGLFAGPLLQEVLDPAQRAAKSDLPVVLEGETGTGKEVVARAVHGWSERKGDFVAVNCNALREGLAEGELFGYCQGAFADAKQASRGLFRRADGGTLFLDEVSDLPGPVQAKLLRVLEQREVQPLGESQPVPIDARVIVATQSPLVAAVKSGSFRSDLFARLDGVTIRIPPLRDRTADVPVLFQRFFAAQGDGASAALEADFVERLCLYDWPFNVRELSLLVKRLHVVNDPLRSLRALDLPPIMRVWTANPETAAPGAVAGGEPDHGGPDLPALLSALRSFDGDAALAASALGVSARRVYRLIQDYSIDVETIRCGGSAGGPDERT
jgi:DNA-binding NtrC family response regulator